MSHRLLRHAAAAMTAVLGAGCAAVNPHVLFADHQTFGLQIANDTATGGGGATIGYKARSVAVVPVSTLEADGSAVTIPSRAGDQRDALSVFAVFRANAEAVATAAPAVPAVLGTGTGTGTGAPPKRPVRIGHVFSTGAAAQMLTQGLACELGAAARCPATAAATEAGVADARLAAKQAAASAAESAESAKAAKVSAVAAKASASAAVAPAGAAPNADDRPYQRPLVFAANQAVGIDFGASMAEQGMAFILGWGTRNIALVPAYAAERDNGVAGLRSEAPDQGVVRDGFSVLGQFRTDTDTKALALGLERYFATGMAAQNLAEGMKAQWSNDGKAAVPK